MVRFSRPDHDLRNDQFYQEIGEGPVREVPPVVPTSLHASALALLNLSRRGFHSGRNLPSLKPQPWQLVATSSPGCCDRSSLYPKACWQVTKHSHWVSQPARGRDGRRRGPYRDRTGRAGRGASKEPVVWFGQAPVGVIKASEAMLNLEMKSVCGFSMKWR